MFYKMHNLVFFLFKKKQHKCRNLLVWCYEIKGQNVLVVQEFWSVQCHRPKQGEAGLKGVND